MSKSDSRVLSLVSKPRVAKINLNNLLKELGVDAGQTRAPERPGVGEAAPDVGVTARFESPAPAVNDDSNASPPIDPSGTASALPAPTKATDPLASLMAGEPDARAPREPGAASFAAAAHLADEPEGPANSVDLPAAAPAPPPELPLAQPSDEAPTESAMVPADAPAIAQESSVQSEDDFDFRTVALRSGAITAKQLSLAETVVRQSPGERLIDALITQGVDEVPLLRALAQSQGLGFERIELSRGPDAFDGTMLQRLGTDYCKSNRLLPLRVEHERVVLGVARPDDVFTIDDAKQRLKARSLKLVVVPSADIVAALALLGDTEPQEVDVESMLTGIDEDDVQVERGKQDAVDLEKEAGESPVIRYVNYIIQTASKEGASDIHIEPREKSIAVRFRIDGVLFETMHPPGKMAAAIISRLKIMANLDISERRLPQDGRIRCQVSGRKLDLRMSTIPTTYGEKVVLRILDTRSISVGLDDLGFDENTLTIWKHQIDQPHGIILVTGPTGSGKTTTLYASLRSMDKVTQNVSTVEDPVEYHLDGITQTQTHEKIGMTFARALKALLRQDPDVIMIGEIRDQETAHTAVQAALTGHLVLSTLHTNDAPSSITRLVNIGIEPFLIGAAVNAALAQRLVRKICPHCKAPAQPTEEFKEFLVLHGLADSELFESVGCNRCRNIGYSGRVGIYELLTVDDHLRDIVARNPNVTEFRRMCCERGMVTLRQDGLSKAARGLTTVSEVLRVTESTI